MELFETLVRFIIGDTPAYVRNLKLIKHDVVIILLLVEVHYTPKCTPPHKKGGGKRKPTTHPKA